MTHNKLTNNVFISGVYMILKYIYLILQRQLDLYISDSVSLICRLEWNIAD